MWTILSNAAHVVIVLGAIGWLLLATTGRRGGNASCSHPRPSEPEVPPEFVDTHTPDPGAPYGDVVPSLPVTPLPPKDTP